MPEDEKIDIKDYLPKRNPDSNLWNKVQQLSQKEDGRIEAIDIIFKQQYKLPEDNIELIKKLAEKEQPKNVRLHIAQSLEKYDHIPFGMYADLFDILSNDPDHEVQKPLKNTSLYKLGETFLAGFKKIQPTVLTNSLKSLVQRQDEILKSMIPLPKIITPKMTEQISQINERLKTLNLDKIKIPKFSFNIDDVLLKQIRESATAGISADAILTKTVETNPELKEAVESKKEIETMFKTLDDISNQLKTLQKTTERNSKDVSTIAENSHKKRDIAIAVGIGLAIIGIVITIILSPNFSEFISPSTPKIHVTDLNAQDGIVEGNKFLYSYEPRSLTPNGTKNEAFTLKISNTGNEDANNFWIIINSKPDGLWFDFQSSNIVHEGNSTPCQQKSSYCTIELVPKESNNMVVEYNVEFDHKLYQEIVNETPKLFFNYGFDEGEEQTIEVLLKFD